MIYITESTVVNKLTVALYNTLKDLPEMQIISILVTCDKK